MLTLRNLAARTTLLTCALLATSHLARAADPTPAPYVRISISSIDAINKFASDLSLPMPVNIQNAVEMQFPFVGPGGLDTSKPLGGVFVAGENLPQSALALFAFPMVQGKSSVDDLKKNFNATPVDNSTDTVLLTGPSGSSVALKRTANYLFMYAGDPAVLAALADNLFDSDYKIPSTLAHLEINGATARAAAPHLTQAFFDNLRTTGNVMPNPLSERTRLATQDFLATSLQKIDLFTLNLAVDTSDIRITSTITPTPAQTTREFPKPVFPSDATTTLDIVYPDTQTAQWLPRLFDNLKDDDLPIPASKLTADQVATERATFSGLIKVLAAPEAQSAAFELKNGKIVITILNQYSQPTDVIGEVQKDVAAMTALDQAIGASSNEPTLAQSKTADGADMLTVTLPNPSNDGPREAFITQTGNTATITISAEDTPTPTTVTLSGSDKISNLLAAHVDLGASVDAAKSQPNVWNSLSPGIQKQLEALAGKSINLTVATDPAANLLHIDTNIPLDLIRVLPTMIMASRMQSQP